MVQQPGRSLVDAFMIARLTIFLVHPPNRMPIPADEDEVVVSLVKEPHRGKFGTREAVQRMQRGDIIQSKYHSINKP